ncbi:hypothetical protein [Streptomyces buecherae]|uniref:hypothetical protein n=1 Tax=Streptomyces buecherae TaxID=2763006 RepID=UPI001E356DF8|nr:hypothetical protein [Streptomyces buecherae]
MSSSVAFLIEHPREIRTLNTQTRFGAGIVLLVAASMTLTACGGDSDSGSDSKDKIKGAETSSTPPPVTSTPSSTPMDDGIDRPEIKLPADVKNVFEDSKTGDPKKDAVLADSERGLNAIDEAITSGSTERPALKFYVKDMALLSALEYIKSYYDAGVTFTGSTRYYNRKVTFLKDGSAVVNYCSDQTKSSSVNKKTGKVKKNEPGPGNVGYYTDTLTKNNLGVWQMTKAISTSGGEKCQA